jgi:hypothetical protein
MSQLDPSPQLSPIQRGIRRILAEAIVVALVGGLVGGLLWEIQLRDEGLIIAGIIWIIGAPALEIIRLLQLRKSHRSSNPLPSPIDPDSTP